MPTPIYVLPDSVLLTIQYLRAQSAVTALVTAGNIRTALPSSPSYPYVLVTLAGGDLVWPALDDSAVQIDTYDLADQKDTNNTLARTVRAAINAIANDVVAAGTLASSSEEIGPQWLPDPVSVPPLARYTQRHRILTHP